MLAGSTPTEVLSYKTKHWGYEDEYRIIRKYDYYPITGRISAVYFGVRTTDFHKELLKKASPRCIKFVDTRLDRKNIVVRPVKEKNA